MSEHPQETIVAIDVPDGYRAGERLDVYVAEKLPNATRTKVQRAIKAGEVTVNDRSDVKVSTPVQAGDRITVRLMRPPPIEAQPEDIPLDIVFEDEVLLVVNKPAGMVVHPAYGHPGGTLVNALLHHVGAGPLAFDGDASDEGGPDEDGDLADDDMGLSTVTAAPRFSGDLTVRPGIVHRLDKGTSGLLVVAKNDVAHAKLAAQFMRHTIERRYLAIVWGVPDPPSGTVDAALGRDPRDRKRMAVVSTERGKRAVTHYDLIESFAHLALMQFRLETGRTHQIRVHARQIGHPVLGDTTYGGDSLRYGPMTGRRRKFFDNLFKTMPRQALHAHTLGFVHPVSGQPVHFEAPLPQDMAGVAERLRSVEGITPPD